VHVGQAEVAALGAVGESRVVDAQLMQNCCVKIVHMDRVLHDVFLAAVHNAVWSPCRRELAGLVVPNIFFMTPVSSLMGEGVLKLARLFPNTRSPQPLAAFGGERLATGKTE
jgi:hypothetical protein